MSADHLATNSLIADLEKGSHPSWVALALMGSSSCAYDWIVAEDKIEWIGNPSEIFGLDIIPRSRADIANRLRPGAVLPLDKNLLEDGGDSFSGTYGLKTRDGFYINVHDDGTVLRATTGRIERVVGTLRLLATTQTSADSEGHMDRAQMRDAIDATIDWAKDSGGTSALLIASIDDLGVINESYGLDTGDAVIAEVGERIAKIISHEGGTTGRIGGNKFAILLLDCPSDEISQKAETLRDGVQSTVISASGNAIGASISIGVIQLPHGAASADLALMRAEESLSRGRRQGRSNIMLYDATEERQAARRQKASIAAEITQALKDGRFRLAYQPIVCSRTHMIKSYEALIRMLRPDGSVVPAGEFIPVAEELGLVRDLDRRVLELAALTLRRAPALNIGINASGLCVADPAWLHVFRNAFGDDRTLTKRLTVEVTETAALHDIEDGIRFVQVLRHAGCRVAIDDFGAGYTSFRNLQILDINCVKIDGSFVKGIAQRPDNQAFVRTLVSLAKTFNLEVVAEWVGTKEEAVLLRALGADKFQGALYGMPAMDIA